MEINNSDLYIEKRKQSREVVTKCFQMLDSAKTSKKLLNIFKLHDKPCLNNLKYYSNSVNKESQRKS